MVTLLPPNATLFAIANDHLSRFEFDPGNVRTLRSKKGFSVSLLSAAISALANVIVLAVLPMLAFAAIQKWRFQRRGCETLKLAGLHLGDPRYAMGCVLVAAGGVAVLTTCSFPIEPFTRTGSPQRAFVGLGLGGQAIWGALLYGVIKTGFAEELLFRGLIAGSLSRRMPALWANLLQAGIFLLPHLPAIKVMPEMWPLLPLVFVMGLVAGWVRMKSGSILGPWVVHAAMNSTVCLVIAVRTAT